MMEPIVLRQWCVKIKGGYEAIKKVMLLCVSGNFGQGQLKARANSGQWKFR